MTTPSVPPGPLSGIPAAIEECGEIATLADLVSACLGVAHVYAHEADREYVASIANEWGHEDWTECEEWDDCDDDCGICGYLSDVFELMTSIAPEGHYFGTREPIRPNTHCCADPYCAAPHTHEYGFWPREAYAG